MPSNARCEGRAADSGGTVRRRPLALIVDDDLLIRTIVGRLLCRNGWQAIVAGNAEEALSLPESRGIDLLITDLELPGVSGLTLALVLRELVPGLPVIVVSGWPEAPRVVEGQVHAFVRKPIDFDEFMTHVRSLAG